MVAWAQDSPQYVAPYVANPCLQSLWIASKEANPEAFRLITRALGRADTSHASMRRRWAGTRVQETSGRSKASLQAVNEIWNDSELEASPCFESGWPWISSRKWKMKLSDFSSSYELINSQLSGLMDTSQRQTFFEASIRDSFLKMNSLKKAWFGD